MCFQLLMGTIRRSSNRSSQLQLLLLLLLKLSLLLQLLLVEMCLLRVLVVQRLLGHQLVPHDVVARYPRTKRAIIMRRIQRLVLLLNIHMLLAAMGSKVLHLRFQLHLGSTRLSRSNRLRLSVRLRLYPHLRWLLLLPRRRRGQ